MINIDHCAHPTLPRALGFITKNGGWRWLICYTPGSELKAKQRRRYPQPFSVKNVPEHHASYGNDDSTSFDSNLYKKITDNAQVRCSDRFSFSIYRNISEEWTSLPYKSYKQTDTNKPDMLQSTTGPGNSCSHKPFQYRYVKCVLTGSHYRRDNTYVLFRWINIKGLSERIRLQTKPCCIAIKQCFWV